MDNLLENGVDVYTTKMYETSFLFELCLFPYNNRTTI